jgi:hypothetical protein
LDDGRLRGPKLYDHFLDELNQLTEDAVIAAFCAIPQEWLGSDNERAHEGLYLLARQPSVGDAVREYVSVNE